jgi:hypothetical protein
LKGEGLRDPVPRFTGSDLTLDVSYPSVEFPSEDRSGKAKRKRRKIRTESDLHSAKELKE